MENEKFIPLDEFIKRAKALGVDFGSGNPKNRLRYLVKLGLLPQVQRKCFGNSLPTGAYPEWVLKRLVEIDNKIKQGKSIAQIKEELSSFPSRKEAKFLVQKVLGKRQFEILFFTLLSFFFAFFVLSAFLKLPPFSNFLAKVSFPKLVQTDTFNFGPRVSFSDFEREPFLTISAETEILSSLSVAENLKVKKEITGETISANLGIFAQGLNLKKGEFFGKLTVGDLTGEREYTFPDSSGIICLSSGNCAGLMGEVTTSGGTISRLAKFVGATKIENSSIQDLFSGVALTISAQGNLGVGTQNPKGKLDVAGSLFAQSLNISGDSIFGGQGTFQKGLFLFGDLEVGGKIHAKGDICTDEAGGKCLSKMITWFYGGGGGISGTGRAGYLAMWRPGNLLGESIITQEGNLVSVNGAFKTNQFYLPSGASAGKFLMAKDESGEAIWSDLTATFPSGSLNQTVRYGAGGWEANSFLWNTGSQIGIGTTSTTAMLTLAGDFDLGGPLKITDFLSDYLKLALENDQALIESTKSIIINSKTGEILLGDDVQILDASQATIQALTFVSGDASARKQGEKILRSAIPIFKYSLPSQTNSTDFQPITKEISPQILQTILPSQIPQTERKFALLLSFADTISNQASSTWQIDFANQQDIEFEFPGQNLPSLEEGIYHLKDNISGLLDDSWVLKVKVPNSSSEIRVFNALLLVYDEVK
ncbi:hypothetical protein H5T58_00110 [Candidatus Parcubacteria bacterium]|nr:hypothetical protein [Candidatus Parcubacteria bacterium]